VCSNRLAGALDFLQKCVAFEREFVRIKEVWDRFYIETAEKRYKEIVGEYGDH
jgi:hypothetical protein